MAAMKAAVLRSLARLRLLRPTYRGYERVRALGHEGVVPAGETLPVPPAKLRIRVAGTADLDWFLESGRLAEQSLRESLGRAGTRLEDMAGILDFGCGCGRVVRRLAALPGEIRGSDLDGVAVDWCRENLAFASFNRNELEPPLPYPSGGLDLVYAFSVLTHLPVPTQDAWMEELKRILRPRGFLVVSTHGERYLERLDPDERAAFERGEVVVRYEEVAGTNLCTTFHPPAYVRDQLGAALELVDEVPEGAKGNPHQDLFLFRKPDARY
jgi:SAM-dependent methyltransferase